MANTITYDPDEHLFSPSPVAANQVLSEINSPIFSALSCTDTKSSLYLSQTSSNGSPPQSIPYSPNLCNDPSRLTHAKNEMIDFSLMTKSTEKLQIIAQPKAFYRERYCSETDPTKHRAQRFIRADDDTGKHEYPTIEVRCFCYYFFLDE
ncbi:unnamed protein product [Rotaria magnacalcarata]|uniref:Uncharacterized protein n=1 Tax=Rotaria magnacalcarata TaxID=392030 RepID=A0A8S2Q6I1_9BILA|nr:unnamed protein product [Rotaria magnacalcarata]